MKAKMMIQVLEIKLTPITEIEIKHVIESFKSNKSPGYDGNPCRISKYCTYAIAKPLSHICKASLNQGIYSDRLKFVIKKGEKSDSRSISFLTTFEKFLEKVMNIRLSQHLSVNNILTLEQLGFQKHGNTNRAIYSLTKYH